MSLGLNVVGINCRWDNISPVLNVVVLRQYRGIKCHQFRQT